MCALLESCNCLIVGSDSTRDGCAADRWLEVLRVTLWLQGRGRPGSGGVGALGGPSGPGAVPAGGAGPGRERGRPPAHVRYVQRLLRRGRPSPARHRPPAPLLGPGPPRVGPPAGGAPLTAGAWEEREGGSSLRSLGTRSAPCPRAARGRRAGQ